jgi:hypothetical protein
MMEKVFVHLARKYIKKIMTSVWKKILRKLLKITLLMESSKMYLNYSRSSKRNIYTKVSVKTLQTIYQKCWQY